MKTFVRHLSAPIFCFVTENCYLLHNWTASRMGNDVVIWNIKLMGDKDASSSTFMNRMEESADCVARPGLLEKTQPAPKRAPEYSGGQSMLEHVVLLLEMGCRWGGGTSSLPEKSMYM